ncbi:MAG: FG-GAP repeat protein [Planctomycetota bacterium]
MEEQTLIGSDTDGGDYFGYSVALQRELAVVGAPWAKINKAGAAYVFHHHAATWEELQCLQASTGGQGGDNMGAALCLDRGRILVGAPLVDTPQAARSGYGYMFAGTPPDCVPEFYVRDPYAWKTIWYVGGEGADFHEIQPAIDAADEGDLILVDPARFYSVPFKLAKALTIRSLDGRFVVAGYPPITIEDVAQGKTACLSGLEQASGWLVVRNCAGDVVLENIALEGGYHHTESIELLKVSQCNLVSLTDVQVLGGETDDCESVPAATARIWRSTVVSSGCEIRGWGRNPSWWCEEDGYPGGAALSVRGGRV